MNQTKASIHRKLLVYFGVAIFLISSSIWWGETNDQGSCCTAISSDGLGYYKQLTSIFIEDNFDTQTADYRFTYPVSNEKVVNKYFSGTPLLMSPFFFISHIVASTTDWKADGFSAPYQWGVFSAGIFYALLGLTFVKLILVSYKVSTRLQFWILGILLFGTNLWAYTSIMPSMSHVYSFSMISGFVWQVRQFWLLKQSKHIFYASIFFGLVLLIRPTNGIILLLVPFLGNGRITVSEWRSVLRMKTALLATIPSLILISIQVVMWYFQTGNLIVFSYSNEGFNWLQPHWFDFLFSFRKGWFIYTPIVLVACFGFIAGWKSKRWLTIGLIIFLVIFTYVSSSWWNWYYGSSFGQRPGVDILIVVSLGLMLIIRNTKWTNAIKLIGLLCVFLNTIQTHQYAIGILSPEHMNLEKWQSTFLNLSNKNAGWIGEPKDIRPFQSTLKEIATQTTKESSFSDQEYRSTVKDTFVFEGNQGLWIELKGNYELKTLERDSLLLTVDIKTPTNRYYSAQRITPYPGKKNYDINCQIHSGSWLKDTCVVSVYIWNQARTKVKLNNMHLKISEVHHFK